MNPNEIFLPKAQKTQILDLSKYSIQDISLCFAFKEGIFFRFFYLPIYITNYFVNFGPHPQCSRKYIPQFTVQGPNVLYFSIHISINKNSKDEINVALNLSIQMLESQEMKMIAIGH